MNDGLILCTPIDILMKRTILSFIGLLAVQLLTAQDTLVYFQDLRYFSSFEQKAFERYSNNDVDIFSLLMANADGISDAKVAESFAAFGNQLTIVQGEVAGRRPERQVKGIYDNLHKKYLAKYELHNRFADIFQNGNYNCVSATALCALAFERYGIPYTIKQEPTHVYLVAYPQTDRIVLQTTSPDGNYMAITDNFKSAVVRALKDQKIISAQEYNSENVNTLFDKYYFGQQVDIDLPKLAGIQYFNDGIYRIEEKDYEGAFAQFEKAYFLYPMDRAAYMLVISGYQAFQSRKEADSTQAVMLGKLSRYSAYNIDEKSILGEFGRITHEVLLEAGNREQYERFYQVLVKNIRSKSLRDEISFYYEYESARSYYNAGRYKESLPYAQRAMKLKPNHLDAQSLMFGALGQTLKNSINTPAAEKILEDYNTRFPELGNNNHFNSMRAWNYIAQANFNYLSGKIAEGERCRLLFEKLSDRHPGMTVDEGFIGQAYSNAAVYYYRKSQVAKAKQMIEAGLKYAPGSYELIARQQMIR